jgi:hypothetical protein
MVFLIGESIDQHVKRNRVYKFVANFDVSALVKRSSPWRRGVPGRNQSSGCQRNKMLTPLLSQQRSDDGS